MNPDIYQDPEFLCMNFGLYSVLGANLKTLRLTLIDCEVDHLKSFLSKLRTVLQEKEQALIECESMQIDHAAIPQSSPESPPCYTGKTKPRYRYVDDQGMTQTWDLHGKPPAPIFDALLHGGSLDDFLIPHSMK